jgi:hypothetical protein
MEIVTVLAVLAEFGTATFPKLWPMWTLFRAENEHWKNVRRFRASRDVPLSYDIRKSEYQLKFCRFGNRNIRTISQLLIDISGIAK